NMQFLALRICLFSALGRKTVTLEELFSGAEFGPNFQNFEVEIPNDGRVTVHQLLDTFPNHKTVKDLDGKQHEKLLEEFQKLCVNGKNAPVDGFMQLRLSQGNQTVKILSVSLQMKLAEGYNSKRSSTIDQETIDKEFKSFAMVNDTLK